MTTAPGVKVSGTGAYLPANIVTNDDLSKRVDTSDEWIRTRTGIKERRLASDKESTSFMAAQAAREAIADAGLEATDIDLILVATITPDMPFPSTSCLVQAELGLKGTPCFDLEAACSGFLYGVHTARGMILSGMARHVLVIGAEKLSSILDWQDRTTCVLFGDGAGAMVFSASEDASCGVIDTFIGADGSTPDLLCMPGGGSSCPATPESIDQRLHFLKMNGKEIFKLAVRAMEQSARKLLEKHDLTPDDVSLIIPHQANLRIIDALARLTKIPTDKFYVNLDRFGNTSAASIPIAFHEARQKGCIHEGKYLLWVAFGAGLTWGSTLLKWHSK